MDVVMDGLQFGESPRWIDGRLWVSDWAAGCVWSLGADGERRVEVETPSFPLCFDALPDGRILVADNGRRALVARQPNGEMTTYADLTAYGDHPWNEVVVDGHGRAYVNNIGFDFPAGEVGTGFVVRVDADGTVTRVAEGLAFPNGMALTADGSILLVAESYAEQVTAFEVAADGTLGERRVWAATPGDHPDGICLDRSGALWYADVGNRHCVRVREGGEVLETVELDRGAFSCVLDDAGEWLHVVGQEWGGDPAAGASGIVARFRVSGG